MKKVDIRRMQAAEMRMMCGKTLHDPNVLLKDRTGVKDIENHLRETRLRWHGHFKRMDETNLIKRVRKKKFHNTRRREACAMCINDSQNRDKWRRCCRRVIDPS